MCATLKGSKIKPGAVFRIHYSDTQSSSIWGFNNGEQYNARSEKLGLIYKQGFTRGYIKTDTFWEREGEFMHINGSDLKLAVLVNKENEFAILTKPANSLIRKFHHRMPVVLDNVSEYLSGFFNPQMLLNDSLITLKS